MYNSPGQRQANILAQLRTGMAGGLNGYLHRIGATESDRCACGYAKETVKHFLFRYRKWDTPRSEMLNQTETARGNLSFHLGGKAPTDSEKWTSNMDAVRATIKYVISTHDILIRLQNFNFGCRRRRPADSTQKREPETPLAREDFMTSIY